MSLYCIEHHVDGFLHVVAGDLLCHLQYLLHAPLHFIVLTKFCAKDCDELERVKGVLPFSTRALLQLNDFFKLRKGPVRVTPPVALSLKVVVLDLDILALVYVHIVVVVVRAPTDIILAFRHIKDTFNL